MASDKKLSEIAIQYTGLENDDLIRILTKDFHEYTPEALEVARKELATRGITDIKTALKTDESPLRKKELKPAIKLTIRIFLYIIWPIFWLFSVGRINDIFVKFAVGVLKEMIDYSVDQNSIDSNIWVLNIVIEALFFIVFWIVIIKRFLVSKKGYQNKSKMFLYFFWPIFWLFSVGFIRSMFHKLTGRLLVAMIDSGIDPISTNIRILAFVGGIVHAALFCILYYILIKGFLVITEETRTNWSNDLKI